MIAFARGDGWFWFRVFGIGLLFKDTSKQRLSFSERNGYAKRIQIGRWSIRGIK